MTWPPALGGVLGGVTVAAGVGAWGACHPSSQIFGRTVTRIPPSSSLALTFDDGPNPAATPQLLDLLDRHQARATFFLVGRWVRACQEIVREIAARGHTIGNHTDTHPNLVWLSTRSIVAELVRCQQSIEQAAAEQPTLMRPPFGFRGPHLQAAVARSRLETVVMWSVMGRDWSPRGKRRLVKRLARVGRGDILVLHDGSHRALGADRTETLRALEHWLPRWRDAGLNCVSLK